MIDLQASVAQGSSLDTLLGNELLRGVASLGLDLPPGAQQRLIAYINLLVRWNRSYNLTAVRDPQAMLLQHILDSLAVLPKLRELTLVGRRATSRVADVGSGAGLPGIPLAIAEPTMFVCSVETAGKKVAFQRQAMIELGLTNLEVHAARVEALTLPACDFVLSRAFSSLADFVKLASRLVAEDGYLCALKGHYPEEELRALQSGWIVADAVKLDVPGLDAQRYLMLLRRA